MKLSPNATRLEGKMKPEAEEELKRQTEVPDRKMRGLQTKAEQEKQENM